MTKLLRTYATVDDYDAVADEPTEYEEPVLLRKLRTASEEVDSLTWRDRFDVDEEGYPTDADISLAFTIATCRIVEYQAETEDTTGVRANEGAVKIGSVSLGTTSSRESTADPTTTRIGPKAARALRSVGLLSSLVGYS